MTNNQSETIKLPHPFITGGLTLSETINQRRSFRDFSTEPVLLYQLSQILWSAQGITDSFHQLRAVPSAGGTYPLEVYAVIGDNSLENTEAGSYHYQAADHSLSRKITGDLRPGLSAAALSQDSIEVAPVSLVICAEQSKTLERYSARGERFVYLEAGHAGQNIYLQATALGLVTLAIGAFRDDEVRKLLNLESGIRPLYIMPVGKKA